MAKFLNNWIFTLVLAVLICVGCKQSNSPVAKDVTQMTFVELKTDADNGNPVAQYEMGRRFQEGVGVLKDSSEAVDWWLKAAVQGFPPAEYDLGLAYGRGDGVPEDKEMGSQWCRRAADAKLPVAEDFEGIAYALGKTSVTQNYSEAFRWFKLAADQNYPPSQYRLAICYRDGKGTETNVAESIAWLQCAASNGLANAQVVLGKYCVDAGIISGGIPEKIKPDFPMAKLRTNSDFVRGVEWFQKAANQGNPDGQIYLGTAYATGCGIDKDLTEAYKWLMLASTNEPDLVTALIDRWKTDKIVFASEQILAGKQRADEFYKTNHFILKSDPEIPGL